MNIFIIIRNSTLCTLAPSDYFCAVKDKVILRKRSPHDIVTTAKAYRTSLIFQQQYIMKQINLFFCFFLSQSFSWGQANLVPNPSFEEYTNCPTGFSTVHNVDPATYDTYNFPQVRKWIRGSEHGSPDYFNSCASANAPRVSTPENYFGNITPRTGKAYAGISSVEHEGSHLEYLQIRLSEPMIAGHNYYVSFWINLGVGLRNTTQIVGVDNIGIVFSDTHSCPSDPARYFTQGIINPAGKHITDTTIWTPITGIYTARGDEEWLVIGAFRRTEPSPFPVDSLVSNVSTSGKVAYYFIDDVSVVDLESQANSHLVEVCDLDSLLTLHNPNFGKGDKHLWNTGEHTESVEVLPKDNPIYWVITENDTTIFIDTFIVQKAEIGPIEITVNLNTLGTTVSFSSYQWMLNGNTIPNATESTYQVLENGKYQVIVSNEDGCMDTSDVYTVSSVGVKRHFNGDNSIEIYPNPTFDPIFIDAPFKTKVSVLSMDGRILISKQETNRVFLQNLSTGIYFLNIFDENDRLIEVKKVVKGG